MNMVCTDGLLVDLSYGVFTNLTPFDTVTVEEDVS